MDGVQCQVTMRCFFSPSQQVFFLSRLVGIYALFHALIIGCLPRVYVGLHYPTDIIVGAVIGIAIAVVGNIYLVKSKKIEVIANWSYSKPSLFYPVFFLVTYQFARMFSEIRGIASWALDLVKAIIVLIL